MMFRRTVVVVVAGWGLYACGSEGAGATGSAMTDAGASPSQSVAADGDASASTNDAANAGDTAPACVVASAPACGAAFPNPGPARAWRHGAPGLGLASPNHRGRDLFFNPGDPQWVIGRFAYGKALAEVAAKDEDVDVWLNRDCGSAWEKLGTVATTETPSRPPIEGVEDAAGRIYFPIPTGKELGLGRHRVRLVMAGDLSSTELFIEVVPSGTPIFMSDVDGTLTTSETVEFTSLLTGSLSPANESAPEALSALAARGYRPIYVTARPEWLVERTREFIAQRGFPPGIIHTTTSGALPANGAAAADFKTDELSMLKGKGLVPAFAIGNTNTDAEAYDNGQVQPIDHRLFFQFGDADGGQIYGGRRFESYKPLVSEFQALPLACP